MEAVRRDGGKLSAWVRKSLLTAAAATIIGPAVEDRKSQESNPTPAATEGPSDVKPR